MGCFFKNFQNGGQGDLRYLCIEPKGLRGAQGLEALHLVKPIAASSRIDGDQFAEVYLKPVNEDEYLGSTSSVAGIGKQHFGDWGAYLLPYR